MSNCDRGAKQFVRSQRASDRRKRVAQGATAGFFAGGLVGGRAGAGIQVPSLAASYQELVPLLEQLLVLPLEAQGLLEQVLSVELE